MATHDILSAEEIKAASIIVIYGPISMAKTTPNIRYRFERQGEEDGENCGQTTLTGFTNIPLLQKRLSEVPPARISFICTFLQTLVNILDKKNSMVPVHSQPSAGKNYFFAAVVAFFLLRMFGTANQTNNNFSFSNGAGKCIVSLWNEPNYESCNVLPTIIDTRARVRFVSGPRPPSPCKLHHNANMPLSNRSFSRVPCTRPYTSWCCAFCVNHLTSTPTEPSLVESHEDKLTIPKTAREPNGHEQIFQTFV
ncbi:hypothetical protein QTP88_026624 [Uroleucon formosanum]